MSIFGAFSIGREGLLAQQRALNVTANNIANVNTPGYTRQRAVFTSTTPALDSAGVPLGGGVQITDVQRIADAALDALVLRERQELGFHNRQ